MEKRGLPMVSVITINFNNSAVTCELLASLEKVTYPELEVIVVDNGSSEDPSCIHEKFPWVNLIRTGKNLGFAGGNNVGFLAARGKYFLMLNNDTEVQPGFIEPLVEKLESDPGAGAVSSKLIYYNSDGIIQYAGSTAINRFTGRSSFIGQNEKDCEKYNVCCETSYAHGAAMMVPRVIVEKIGLMADLYFLYYEELDFCERIKKAGYSIWFIGTSVVYHKESMSVGKESPLKAYYMTRNRLLFMRRNIKGISLTLNLMFFSFISIPKNIFLYTIRKRNDLTKAFLKGYFWNWFNQKIYDNPKLQNQ